MKSFRQYVLDWWDKYTQSIDETTAKRIMENEFIGEEETVEDYIPTECMETESCCEWLSYQDDAEKIYEIFFGYNSINDYDNVPDTDTFLTDMFMQAASWFDPKPNEELPSFSKPFIEDMAMHVDGYDTPLGFFQDLQHGCQSGMIGMLIYNSDCKDIYIEHMDDMEEYVEQIEGELGAPINNRDKLPHATLMCWVCYEELGFQIACTLFPDKF